MFASAGSLTSTTGVPFAEHRDDVKGAAMALVECTKGLVAGAAAGQTQLAAAADGAMATFRRLADGLKAGAASLGVTDSNAQVGLWAARVAALITSHPIRQNISSLGEFTPI